MSLIAMSTLGVTGCDAQASFRDWVLYLVEIFSEHPYTLIFTCLFVCGLGVPLPEEFFLILAGYVCFKIGAGWTLMALVTMAAIIGGDSLTYWMGRVFKGRIFELGLVRRSVSPELVARATEFLEKHGNKTIFAVRFMPGIRMPTYLICGVLGVSYPVFLLYDGLASILSAPIQVYLSWKYGQVLEESIARVARFNSALLYLLIAGAVIFYLWAHFGPARRAKKTHSQRLRAEAEKTY